MNKQDQFLLQWPDGEFICDLPLASSPFASFAKRFIDWETNYWMWRACGVIVHRIEEGPSAPALVGCVA